MTEVEQLSTSKGKWGRFMHRPHFSARSSAMRGDSTDRLFLLEDEIALLVLLLASEPCGAAVFQERPAKFQRFAVEVVDPMIDLVLFPRALVEVDMRRLGVRIQHKVDNLFTIRLDQSELIIRDDDLKLFHLGLGQLFAGDMS